MKLLPAVGLLCVVMAAGVSVSASAAGSVSPPLHVLREVRDAQWLEGANHTLQLACLATQGIVGDAAEAKVKPVPDSVRTAFVWARLETLYDGSRQATYRTLQSLYLHTKASDCSQPKLIRAYEAIVDSGCELAARGTSHLRDPQTGEQAPVDFRSGPADGKTATCRPGPAPKRSMAGLPVYRPGGVACVSLVDAMNRALGRPVTPREFDASEGADSCLLAELPYYNGEARPVVVAGPDGRSAEQLAFDTELARGNGGRLSSIKLVPVSVQLGAPVPAQRFSAEAARSFVNQASEFSLNEANAAMK